METDLHLQISHQASLKR